MTNCYWKWNSCPESSDTQISRREMSSDLGETLGSSRRKIRSQAPHTAELRTILLKATPLQLDMMLLWPAGLCSALGLDEVASRPSLCGWVLIILPNVIRQPSRVAGLAGRTCSASFWSITSYALASSVSSQAGTSEGERRLHICLLDPVSKVIKLPSIL